MRATYIAVHGGAGTHSPSSDRQVKQALRRCEFQQDGMYMALRDCLIRACAEAMKTLKNDAAALISVEQAVSVLENDECLNAGTDMQRESIFRKTQ